MTNKLISRKKSSYLSKYSEKWYIVSRTYEDSKHFPSFIEQQYYLTRTTAILRYFLSRILSAKDVRSYLKGVTKLSFMHSLCLVIILINTDCLSLHFLLILFKNYFFDFLCSVFCLFFFELEDIFGNFL